MRQSCLIGSCLIIPSDIEGGITVENITKMIKEHKAEIVRAMDTNKVTTYVYLKVPYNHKDGKCTMCDEGVDCKYWNNLKLRANYDDVNLKWEEIWKEHLENCLYAGELWKPYSIILNKAQWEAVKEYFE